MHIVFHRFYLCSKTSLDQWISRKICDVCCSLHSLRERINFELASYTLKMASFEDNLDRANKAGLFGYFGGMIVKIYKEFVYGLLSNFSFSGCSTKTSSVPRPFCRATNSATRAFCAQDDCDWFKEMQPTQKSSQFSMSPNVFVIIWIERPQKITYYKIMIFP